MSKIIVTEVRTKTIEDPNPNWYFGEKDIHSMAEAERMAAIALPEYFDDGATSVIDVKVVE